MLYVGGYHTEAGLIKRQMVDQGMKTILVSGDALVTDEYWQITGDAGAGTLMTFSPDPRKNPIAKPVVDALEAAGKTAEGYSLYTYGAIQAWAEAVKAAGTTDFDPVVAELASGHLQHRPRRHQVRRQGRRHPAGLRLLRVEERHLRLPQLVAVRLLGTDRKPRRKRRGFSFCATRLSLGA